MLETESAHAEAEGKRIGIREFKAHLSRYLRRVETGEVLVITDHGRPIARLFPAAISLEDRMQAMVDAGLADWNGDITTPADFEPSIRIAEGKTIAEMILEDRR